MKPMYFGCWTDVGHHLYDQNGQYVERATRDLLIAMGIDGGFLPKERREHGAAQCLWLGRVSVLSIHDFAIDSRPGSHSTFILPGNLSIAAAVKAAECAFPHVMKRFDAVRRES